MASTPPPSKFILAMFFFPVSIHTLCQSTSIIDQRDGNSYETVTVGSLKWMNEDLRYQTEDSHCPNYNSGEDCENSNFYSNNELGKLCPEGWRLPTINDWKSFIDELDIETVKFFEKKEAKFRINFLNRYNLFKNEVLNLKPIGRTEGNVWAYGYLADYWTTNVATGDKRYHMHIDGYSIVGHTHKHHISSRNERKNRKFAVRCVCEKRR